MKNLIGKTRSMTVREERYRAMFETMVLPSCLSELIREDGNAADYRVLDMNPAFCMVFGLKREEALGQLASKLFREGEGGSVPFLEAYAHVAETGEPAVFEAFFASIRRSMKIAVSSPARGSFQTVFTDITTYRDKEVRNAHLASFPALNRNPVLEIGIDGNLRYANAAALDTLRQLGLEEDARQFLPAEPAELARLHSLCVRNPLRQEFLLGEGAFLRDIAASDEDSLRVYVIDITRRYQLEREIQLLNAELDTRVRERTAELSAANRELEAYSYSVSHDLRTPLRGIDGFSHALLEDYGPMIPLEGRRYLERIRGAAQRMGELIEDMLLLSQVTRTPLDFQPTDISAMASTIAQRLAASGPDRRVLWDIQGGMEAFCDPRLMEIILTNLLENAWKFTSRRDLAKIDAGSTLDSERGLAFFVRDDGAGFDPAYVGKLFIAFQRLHSQSEFPGTGVGLATVDRAVRRHGGTVWAEGEPDRGATFYFTIPHQRAFQRSKETQA
jgi:PAS domain S-box-containing protein